VGVFCILVLVFLMFQKNKAVKVLKKEGGSVGRNGGREEGN
jgi:hypothetical protein